MPFEFLGEFVNYLNEQLKRSEQFLCQRAIKHDTRYNNMLITFNVKD